MNNIFNSPKAFAVGLISAVAVYIPLTALGSGAGTLADQPLFTANTVKPNILFMVDDSGSMEFELSTVDPTPIDPTAAGTIQISAGSSSNVNRTYYLLHDANDNVNADSRIAPGFDEMRILGQNNSLNIAGLGGPYEGIWRARNSDFNNVYYDPTVVYEPWDGVDENGNPYTDAIADPSVSTRVLLDPYDANSSNVTGDYDLTATDNFTTFIVLNEGGFSGTFSINTSIYPATYWTWDSTGNESDSDGDGSPVDPGERGTKYVIQSGGTYPKASSRTDCAGTSCSYTEEIKNFGNWWQYHRRREYAMKSSMVEVFESANGVNIGMATINSNPNNSGAGEIQINDIDTPSHKSSLIDSLFKIHSQSGTPLNVAMRDSGRYFECTGGPFGSNNCPLDQTLGRCQSNFTVLLTDGAYSTSDEGAFSTPNNADSNNTSGNNTIFDGGPYSDSVSDTLADIGMYFYERDLHDDIPDNVPTQCGVDQNDAQHMVTYAVSFGLETTIDMPRDTSGRPLHPILNINGQGCGAATTVTMDDDWPSKTGTQLFTTQERVNELVHLAYNGRGDYFEASDADQLTVSLQSVLNNIDERTSGTSSGVAFNATTLGTDSTLYIAQFETGTWAGDLLALDIIDENDADTNNDGTLSTAEAANVGNIGSLEWSAANRLDNLNPTSRHIWSHDGSEADGTAGINFEWASLSQAQKNDFRTTPTGVIENENGTVANDPADDPARDRLDYVRGDRTNESQNGGALRNRDSRLGDIVNSGAVFIGIPSVGWPDTAPFPDTPGQRYSDFRIAQSEAVHETPNDTSSPVIGFSSKRTEVVYVGANDGMLHAFRAQDSAENSGDGGQELFAYIPSYLYSSEQNEGLHYLSDPGYSHRFSHDLTPAISDVYINGAWKTILVGGHGAGGRGFFALDITDPDSFDDTNPVMWEFRGEAGPNSSEPLGDANLGFTYSRPTIVLTNAIKGGNNRWAAVFGNGFKEDGDSSGNGNAHLFVVFLDPDLSDGWTLNDDYLRIDTGSNGGISPNGLSTPALVDLDNNGTADRAYAGDMAGDMWAFDLCNRNGTTGACQSSGWGVGLSGNALFTGPRVDDDGDNSTPLVPSQFITTRPQIIDNPRVATTDANDPNLIVLFGSGRYISEGDPQNTDTQSFYGVWDNGTGNRTQASLQAQEVVPITIANGANQRTITNRSVDYPSEFGWYIDLPVPGERSVSNSVVRSGVVFFSTIVPSSNPCEGGGSGFVMFVDAVDGSAFESSVFDFDGDGVVNTGDLVGANNDVGVGIEFTDGLPSAPGFLGDTIYVAGSKNDQSASGTGTPSPGSLSIDPNRVNPLSDVFVGRLSWGELQQESIPAPSSPPSSP